MTVEMREIGRWGFATWAFYSVSLARTSAIAGLKSATKDLGRDTKADRESRKSDLVPSAAR